ncbi:accessory Sec system protein Asp3 [Staphylococcus shinii]|uniref:accessory Sec system protein Asp3 n=1 Tax=Staphylococcus shinii TaxID=2912228 RepID=UPI003CFA4586
MKNNSYYRVYWTQINHTTFMNGSQVKFKPYKTEFINPLMPSGTLIHEWLMMASYYKDRVIPTLPILKKGTDYELQLEYKTIPENSIYLKIVFYRKNDTILDTCVIRNKDFEFTFPKEAHSYKIQLFNAGIEKIIFNHITIKEKGTSIAVEKLDVSAIYNENEKINVRNIIIVEPSFIPQNNLMKEAYDHIDNVVIVNNWYNEDIFANLNEIIKFIQKVKQSHKVNIIGYGSKSNSVASTLGKIFNIASFVTFHDNKDVFLKRNLIEILRIKDHEIPNNPHMYVTEVNKIESLKMVENRVNQSRYLKYLNKLLLNNEMFYETLY